MLLEFDYDGFERMDFRLLSGSDKNKAYEERKPYIDIVVDKLMSHGFDYRIMSGISEAVRNAHEHGNRFDPDKQIGIGSKIDDNIAQIFVEDGGEGFDGQLLPFSIYVADCINNGDSPIGFYQFNDRFTPKDHSGVGTYIMHLLADKVTYHHSDKGGLLVNMIYSK